MNGNQRKKYLLIVGAGVLVVVAAAGLVVIRTRAVGKQQEKRRVVALPPVISHVRQLEVVSATVRGEGTPQATAVVEIRNNSDQDVMALEISTRNDTDSAAVNVDGLDDPDNPHAVLHPHQTTTLKMSFLEMIPDAPLVVSAAVFADGSEDGDWWSVDSMRAIRNRRYARIKAQRGGPKQ